MMTHQLRTLADLPKDPASVPSTHMAAHNHLELQFQGIRHPILASAATRLYMWCAEKTMSINIKKEGKKGWILL